MNTEKRLSRTLWKNCPTPLKRSNYACMSTKYKIKDEKRQNFMYIQWQYPPRFKTRLKTRPKMCSMYYHILVGRCKLWRKKCDLYTPWWAHGNVDILKLQLWSYPTFFLNFPWYIQKVWRSEREEACEATDLLGVKTFGRPPMPREIMIIREAILRQ